MYKKFKLIFQKFGYAIDFLEKFSCSPVALTGYVQILLQPAEQQICNPAQSPFFLHCSSQAETPIGGSLSGHSPPLEPPPPSAVTPCAKLFRPLWIMLSIPNVCRFSPEMVVLFSKIKNTRVDFLFLRNFLSHFSTLRSSGNWQPGAGCR